MVDLSGHEAGNGGYSQRKPTYSSPGLLYSESCEERLISFYKKDVKENISPMTGFLF
jgi:hypothetical protein